MKWTGFDALSKGTFGNGGQNIYVSKKGILQRIWRFDTTNKGYIDLLIANSHDFNEHPRLHIIHDPAGNASLQEVFTQGAQGAAVADIAGNGYDSLAIGVCHDGHHTDLASYVYFGGPDGITENRKIDLAAPACNGVAAGDFDNDGMVELAYLVADAKEASSPFRFNERLRIYHRRDLGFAINDFTELPLNLSFITAGDINGDGYCDLFCRTEKGEWFILWGSKNGLSAENRTDVGEPTDDSRFNVMPNGGGNVRYMEAARPKILDFNGKTYVAYCTKDSLHLIHYTGTAADEDIVINVPNVICAASGKIEGSDKTDLVLLTVDGTDQKALVFYGSKGYASPVAIFPVLTPRDVLIHDFSGNGYGDIAIAQGRDACKFTTESLLFLTDKNGICPEPKRFTTHNAVQVMAADFDGSGKPQLVFVNQQQSSTYGHVPVYVYLGGEDGYRPDRRYEFTGHSAGSMIAADFNDDGLPDILLLNNAEDQPQLDPPSSLFWGSTKGFDETNHTDIPTHLSWGGHVGDLNKDGYLDIIACGGNTVRILWGGPDGYSEANMTEIEIAPKGEACGVLWPAIGDLNGNGWLDIVVPVSWKPYSIILWGGPDGYSLERSTKLPIENALTVRIADLNKDGYPELVFGSRASYFRNYYQEGTVTIFWGSKDGYSGFDCCVLPSYQSNCITIADFNNDGWLDIFASSYFNKKERDINSFIYWNDKGHFSLANRKRMYSHSSSAALAGDFNEDGYVDLCLTNHRAFGNHRTESAIWWNGPDGFKEENRTWLPTIGPHDMVANDIGNVMDRSMEETYITPVDYVDGGIRSIDWEGILPKKTWVNAQIATADSPEALATAEFIGADGTGSTRLEKGSLPNGIVHGAYFKIKLFLGAVNSGNTPRIVSISAE